MEPVRVGVIGAGYISGIYLENSHKFKEFEVVAVADIVEDRARAQAEKYDIPKAMTPDELINDDDVELVVSLTFPTVHADIAKQTLEAGKAAYSEKPFATTREDGRSILEAAKTAGKLVGCAPDTFLGAGIQTVRHAIDDGLIGKPIAARCGFSSPGPAIWHPDPGFFFQPGAGPVLDMGPYYLTNLVVLFGSIKTVTATGISPGKERTIGQGPKAGQTIPVDVYTTVLSTLEMQDGTLVDLFLSWDCWGSDAPNFEVYGADGALSGWDPNYFGGPVKYRNAEISAKAGHDMTWEELPLVTRNDVNSRGLGVADMALSMRTGKTPRASGEMAYHVLDGMLAILDSADQHGKPITLESTATRPDPLPEGLDAWTVTPSEL